MTTFLTYFTASLIIFLVLMLFLICMVDLTIFCCTFYKNHYKMWKKVNLTKEDLEKSRVGWWNKYSLRIERNGYDNARYILSFLFPYILDDIVDEQTVLIIRFSNNYKLIKERFKELKKT